MTGRPLRPAAGDERATDDALRAIAEPRRRAILRLVARDELAAGEIARAFDVTQDSGQPAPDGAEKRWLVVRTP